MQKKRILIIALVFVLLIAGAAFAYNKLDKFVDIDRLAEEQNTQQKPEEQDTSADPKQESKSETGQAQQNPQVPDVVLTDWEGNTVHLSDYIGKPIVLNFWASWCGPCQSEMPDFQKVYEELGNEIQFLMVNVTGGRETVDSAKAFIEKNGYTFPVVFDTTEMAAQVYGAYSIPMTLFIDVQGRLVTYAKGAIPEELLRKGIGMMTEKQ